MSQNGTDLQVRLSSGQIGAALQIAYGFLNRLHHGDHMPGPYRFFGGQIAHQIAHLLWTDRVALLSVTDESGFADMLTTAAADPGGFVDAGAEELAAVPAAELLADWRDTRAQLHAALLEVADGRKLPWFGPPMSASSMATGRGTASGNRAATVSNQRHS